MSVKKLKYYIEVTRWEPARERNGFTIPGNWGRHYTHKFNTPIERDNFVEKNKAEWENATAPDGHSLYKINHLNR
jgi:hypothetical protein